ncbi:MAG: S8 family serine peptidase [Gammaproteobacteria bacterium]
MLVPQAVNAGALTPDFGDRKVTNLEVSATLKNQWRSKGVHKADQALYEIAMEHAEWHRRSKALRTAPGFVSRSRYAPIRGEYIVIDALAKDDVERLKKDLERLGLRRAAIAGDLVTGEVPIAALEHLEDIESMEFVRPAYMKLHSGLVLSEGDTAMRADLARAAPPPVNGAGVPIGVLSDSYDCLGGAAAGVASDDLPNGVLVPGVVILKEGPCADGTDEGRAMMELIHDVAPGSPLLFHTAFDGQASFAQGIIDLHNAGARVIVDDVIYFAEPMFQDGKVAQAVDKVVAGGAAYYSSAGNQARQSYEGRFRNSRRLFDVGFGPVPAHDFRPGRGVDVFQRIRIPRGKTVFIVMQWAQPFRSVSGRPGSRTDLDVLLVNRRHTAAVAGSIANNLRRDPFEAFEFTNNTKGTRFDLLVLRSAGRKSDRFKYVDVVGDARVLEYRTDSGTVWGHANAAGAEAVGAADYLHTPPFNVTPPIIEPYSSAGGVRIRLDQRGGRLRRSVLRLKPGIVAPDGTNTTFFFRDRADDLDTLPNFFGTSAAAPHAAAIAALLLEKNPHLSPRAVYEQLRYTAVDMDDPATSGFNAGFDFGTGYGLVDAVAAVVAVPPRTCEGMPATITGSSGPDVILGTVGQDVIVGGAGDDNINGLGGDDLICGEDGNDILNGDVGTDALDGGAGTDQCLNGEATVNCP